MKYLLIFLSSFIVFVANAEPPVKDVNVVNTPDVNVVSMPSVEVTVPNTLDVNVQNTPGVTIENGPLEPVPVEITNQSDGDGELINIPLSGYFNDGSGSLLGRDSPWPPNMYTVPNGKKLIVKHVSCGSITTAAGIEYRLYFNTVLVNNQGENAYRNTTYISSTFYPIMLTKVFTSGAQDTYSANHEMLAVVGGDTSGGTLILGGYRSTSTGNRGVYCSLTGKLQNL